MSGAQGQTETTANTNTTSRRKLCAKPFLEIEHNNFVAYGFHDILSKDEKAYSNTCGTDQEGDLISSAIILHQNDQWADCVGHII